MTDTTTLPDDDNAPINIDQLLAEREKLPMSVEDALWLADAWERGRNEGRVSGKPAEVVVPIILALASEVRRLQHQRDAAIHLCRERYQYGHGVHEHLVNAHAVISKLKD